MFKTDIEERKPLVNHRLIYNSFISVLIKVYLGIALYTGLDH